MTILLQTAAAAAIAIGLGVAADGGRAAPPLKMDNVRLLVTDFDGTFAFYRDVLGLTVTWGAPGENYASFSFAGGGQIALFKRAIMADAIGAAARPSTRQEQDTA